MMEQIRKNEDRRQTLIGLKSLIREKEQREQLQKDFEADPEVLLDCLKDPDAKTRKNAALILGALSGTQIPAALWEAYQTETQLFVKADYLKALQNFDCRDCLAELRARRDELQEQLQRNQAEENKHLRAELEQLRKLLLGYDRLRFHAFVGEHTPADVILTTNRGQERVTADQISTGKVHLLKGGVLVEQADISYLCEIRTFRDLYFCLSGSRKMREDKLTEELLQTNLMELLKKLLKGSAPYYFRIDLRSPGPLSERSAFLRKLAAELETASEGKLINQPSGYEMELRLVENRDGTFYPLLKLAALPDRRFAYRRKTVAASMAPVQAAICMELASPYLKEKARVLDPFCGVGTMLLERNYRVKADTLYGIDSYAPAIEGGRENAEAAGIPVHYINRDSLTFRHEYPFDEIVTDFPVKGKTKDAHAIDVLYGQFFDKAEELLKPEGVILLYSHDRGYVKKHLRLQRTWKSEKEWCISEKEDAWLFCIRHV